MVNGADLNSLVVKEDDVTEQVLSGQSAKSVQLTQVTSRDNSSHGHLDLENVDDDALSSSSDTKL